MDNRKKELSRQSVTDLFSLLRGILQQESAPTVNLAGEEFESLLKLSKRHEVQSMTAYGLLLSEGLSKEQEAQCRNLVYKIMVYMERMERVFVETCELLETAGLPYMPLKGAVIRSFYPEPWMRTSGDIDILVRDVDAAAELLIENGYIHKGRGSHDVTLISPMGVTIELHFQLIDTDPRVNMLLEEVWQHSFCREHTCRYEMTPEMCYFYHIAHMAKHMISGGCGIRYFLDIWLLLQKLPMDLEKKKQLLRAGGLFVFAEQAEYLSQVWFGNRQPDSLVQALGDFVLDGSIFGSKSNQVKLRRSASDTSVGFLLRRIFLPYDWMVLQYPKLKKYPKMLPMFWIIRWIARMLNPGKIRSAAKELRLSRKLDRETVSSTKHLFRSLELD